MTGETVRLAAALGKVEESEALNALCAAAEAELAGALKEGLAPADCGGAFPLAAAWLALAGLGTSAGGGLKRLTAGEVTLEREEAAQRRQVLRLQAMQVMRPYLKDGGFAFLGVRG